MRRSPRIPRKTLIAIRKAQTEATTRLSISGAEKLHPPRKITLAPIPKPKSNSDG